MYDNFNKDETFMSEAIKEALKAYELDETPIGAVVVYNGEIVGRGFNSIEYTKDPTMHAEISAIREAAKNLNRWRLSDCELYVTMEPCFMCAGAIINSRIKSIHIGVKHEKNHIVDKHNNMKKDIYSDSKIDVSYGILEEECRRMLVEFFSNKRNSKK